MGDAWHLHRNGRVLYGDESGGATLAGVAARWARSPQRDAALAEAEQLISIGIAVRRAFAPDLAVQTTPPIDPVTADCPGCYLAVVVDDAHTVTYRGRPWHGSCWASNYIGS